MNNEVESNIIKRYDIKNRIGVGAYGIVWKAIDKKTGEYVALKKIFDAFKNETDAQRTFREIAFLQEFSGHPNIITLINVRKAENNRDIYLVFELMDSDLHNVIKRGNLLKNVHKEYIIYQILKALKYIHSGNVIHRDLKPSNVLLDSDCTVKLCDFGLTRSLHQLESSQNQTSLHDFNTDPTLTEYVATRWYRSPEILLGSTKYSKSVDLWSVGCILAEIVLGKALFTGSSSLNQIEKIVSALPRPNDEDINSIKSDYCKSILSQIIYKPGKKFNDIFPATVDQVALDLIVKLLQFNPNKRLTVEEALKHQYVEKFHDPNLEIVIDHEIVPPINDECQLSIEEYRSKLYDMIMQKKAEKEARNQAKLMNGETKSKYIADVIQRSSTCDQKPVNNISNKSTYDIAFGRTTYQKPSPKANHNNSLSNSNINSLKPAVGKVDNTKPEGNKNKIFHNSNNRDEINLRNETNIPKKPFGNDVEQKRQVRNVMTYCKEASNPVILRDLHTPSIAATGSKVSIQSRSVSAQHARSNSASMGRRQFDNAKNNSNISNLRSTYGSYSQTYGTVTSSQLNNMNNRNCVR